MKVLLGFVVAAGCVSEPREPQTCQEAQRVVEQEHGVCLVPAAVAPFDNCPLIVWAYCGDRANCPDGWDIACDENDANCTYGITDPGCTDVVLWETVRFEAYQVLDGKRGLLEQPKLTEPEHCRFTPCL
jgi:hypothetical protein